MRSAIALIVLVVGCSSSSTPDKSTGDGGTASGEGGTTPTPPPVGWRAAVGAGGVLVQTFDERTWETRTVASHDLYAVACLGNQLGWAAGAGGAVAKTTDGGKTWAAEDSHLTGALRAIRFADTAFGVVAGDGGALATSHDGGLTWTPATSGTAKALRGVVTTGKLALAVGDGGALVRSEDAGATFQASTIPGATDLQGVASDDGAHLVVAVDAAGAIWASTDRGQTWKREGTAPGALRGVGVHPQGLTALVAGDGGVALERSAAGTWATVATGTTANLRAALVADDGTIDYVAGDRGTLLGHARSSGAAFTAVASGTTADLFGLEDL